MPISNRNKPASEFAAIAPVFASSPHTEKFPVEFVTQVLEPTGGKILRPKDWHYSEGHNRFGYVWTLSREDLSKCDSYTTGFRIQVIVPVTVATGMPAQQFVLGFSAHKKDEGARIIGMRDQVDQGLFTRIGLETEEGRYHILYSLFWGNNMDVAIITTAGTTRELCAIYAPIFDRMVAFEPIDMTRYQ